MNGARSEWSAAHSALKMEDRHGCQREAHKTTTPLKLIISPTRENQKAITPRKGPQNSYSVLEQVSAESKTNAEVNESWRRSGVEELNSFPFSGRIRHLQLLPVHTAQALPSVIDALCSEPAPRCCTKDPPLYFIKLLLHFRTSTKCRFEQ